MAKKTAKKTDKKTAAAKKTAKAAKPSKKETDSKERRQAKGIGISLPQFRILKVLGRCELSYSQIKSKTGYYSNLTVLMRVDHEDSLCDKKMTREQIHDTNGRDTLVFQITATGKNAIAKAVKIS